MNIERRDVLHVDQETGAFYDRSFRRIDALTVFRHLMTPTELDAVCQDSRIQKWTARDDAANLVGLAVITNDLEAWPLISHRYFRREFPELYERQAIWYIGFVASIVHEAFVGMIREMQVQVKNSHGLAVMDFSDVILNRELDKRSLDVQAMFEPTVEFWGPIGSQTVVAYSYKNGG